MPQKLALLGHMCGNVNILVKLDNAIALIAALIHVWLTFYSGIRQIS